MKRRIGFVAVAAIVTSLTLSVPVFAQSTCTQTQTKSKTQTQTKSKIQTQTQSGSQTQTKAGQR